MENTPNAVTEGKNSSPIVCQRCQTVILLPRVATFAKKQVSEVRKRNCSKAPGENRVDLHIRTRPKSRSDIVSVLTM